MYRNIQLLLKSLNTSVKCSFMYWLSDTHSFFWLVILLLLKILTCIFQGLCIHAIKIVLVEHAYSWVSLEPFSVILTGGQPKMY